MVNIEYRKSINEVLEILQHTRKEDVEKISPKFLAFLNKNALTEYEPHLNHSKRIKEMGLNDRTIAILSIIASKYWLTGKAKENFENRLKENEKKYQEKLLEKYNPDNLFKNKSVDDVPFVEETSNSVAMVEYKESVFTKIKNWIRKFFNR